MTLAVHLAFLVAVPDDVGGMASPQGPIGDEETATRLMDQLNAVQLRYDGTEPWRVFPIGEPFSIDPKIRRHRLYKKQRRKSV